MDDRSNKCLFQLRRVGTPATCKGISNLYRLHQGKTLIGRHITAVDIYLNSSVNKQLISRQHAELCIENKHNTQVVHLVDKSTNGTFVNDVKICGKVKLEDCDILTFGHVQGVRIQPGMLRSQPQSEFRFMLEKVHSENMPPSDKLYSPLSSFTYEANVNYQLDQAMTTQGHAKPIVPCIKQYFIDPIPHACMSTDAKTQHNDSLHRISHSAHQKEKSLVMEKCDDFLSATAMNPLVTTGQLQPLTCPKDLPVMKASTTKLEDAAPRLSDEADTKHILDEENNSSADERPMPSVHGPVKAVVVQCNKDADKNQNTDTDIVLHQLTSIISAKVAHFDDSDSENDSEEISPFFHKRMQTLLPSTYVTSEKWQATCEVMSESYPRSTTGSSVPASSQQSQPSTPSNTSVAVYQQATDSSTAAQLLLTTQSMGDLQFRKRGHTSGNKKKKKQRRAFSSPSNKLEMVELAADPMQAEVEICDSHDCSQPTDKTVDWVQCDGCDKWYHVACVGCDYDIVRKDSAAFHCGCTRR